MLLFVIYLIAFNSVLEKSIKIPPPQSYICYFLHLLGRALYTMIDEADKALIYGLIQLR